MNERINGIWWKARIGYNNQSCDPEVIERFAELIIQECIEELEVSKKGDIYTGDLFDCEWNDCIDRQIEVLKEEFGVK